MLEAIHRTYPSIVLVLASIDPAQRSRVWNAPKTTGHHSIIPTLDPTNLAAKLKEITDIGTDATRSSIIQRLIYHEFLLKKDKAVQASNAGVSLIAAAQPAVADPSTTASWQRALDMIEVGTVQLDDLIAKQGAWIGKLVAQYRQTTLNIKVLEDPPCLLCQGKLAQRKGKSGDFWPCLRYLDCKILVSVEASKGKGKGGSGKAKRSSAST
ncbi:MULTISPECIES: DNA topoisomerase [unclassified Pseudomonas]|uniref:DNA topoisomerase n=1 Tax=unclassified Pseudomonas TaxID=196821 RepID=UPI002114C761|nr:MULTISPECIES: DNA topoisomerase [unclassified Pseudomonas]